MNIIQKPDPLSLSGNIKELRIGTTDTISFRLSQGNREIASRSYEPGADGIVLINFKELVHAQLLFTLKQQGEVYEQSGIVSDFTAVIDDEEVTFRVIRSGVDSLAESAENFLKQNFLTWQPTLKSVTYYSPEFLSYYAPVDCSAKLRAYFTNEEGAVVDQSDILLSAFAAGKAYTMPLQYAAVAAKLGNRLPAFYDVWVENADGERLTYIQRYYASDFKSEEEQWILFENSLGGIDTFRAYGSTKFTGEHKHNVAEIDEVSLEYRVDTERKFQKNTGYLNKKERVWFLDFFPSLKKYLYADDFLRQIVVTESNVTYADKELPSNYTFTYRFADAKPLLNLPRTDIPAEALDIVVPDLGSFTVPPRLVEFPRLPLSEGALFPVQDPYSERWAVTTSGSLSDFIAERLSQNYGGGGGVGHQHANIDLLQLLSYISEYLLIAGKKIKAGYADKAGGIDGLDDLYLSKSKADSTKFFLEFLAGIKVASGLETDNLSIEKLIHSVNYEKDLAGWLITAAGEIDALTMCLRKSLEVAGHTKTKTLEVIETLSAKLVTSEKVSANEISAALIEAVQVIGDNIIANEGVAGKNLTASEKVTGKSLVAKEDISGVTADILDKTTTLNLLVKNLAEIYDLNVSHVATLMGAIVKEYISSESFVSGFAGEGMKIYKALNGDWNMEIDNLTVRKIFSVFELVVQRIMHQGGMVIRSAAGGKLTKVTDGGTYWRCEHDSTDDFALNDQIICQAFTGNQAKRYWRLVTSAGVGYFNLSKADCEAGSNNPEAGDEVAVLGNRTNTARQKAQIDCAVGDNAPYRDDYDNINSYSLVGKLITRTGNLSGITDAVFGVLSGSGLYGTNVYLKGTFRLISGKTVEEAITDAQVLAQEYSDNKLTAFKTTTYQSDIQALQESISLKVSSTTYQQDQSLVTTRLSAAEAKITDEAIRFTVKSQTETIAKSAVDGIQVGGRNLALDSKRTLFGKSYKVGDFDTSRTIIPGEQLTVTIKGTISTDKLFSFYFNGGAGNGYLGTLTKVADDLYSLTANAPAVINGPAITIFLRNNTADTDSWTFEWIKLETGNKRTDWTPAPEDIENRVTTVETNFEIREGQISSKVSEATTAAANAKQSETNASGSAGVAGSKAGEASNYAGNAKKSADDANVSLLNVIAKESSINQTANSITLQVTEVTQKAKDAAFSATESSSAAELAMAMSKGKMLYRDASFLEGVNGISRYNNNSSTPNSVTLTREQGGINTYQLRIRIIGPATPGLGGFFFNTQTGPSKIFVTRFIAKFPIGYTVNFTSNAFGSGASFKWLTSRKGTGKWEEYAVKAVCGDTGTFSTTNFFYLDGAVPTPEAPLDMLLSYATVFEVTAAEIDYLADAAEKYTTKTEFSTSITQLSNSIELKVAKTDFNALDIRVSTAETTITQHTSQIALKASNTDLTALGNRVSAAELKITSDAINLTVKSQTDTITQKAIDTLSNKMGTQLLPNDWTLGTGGTPFYYTNGMLTENERIIGVNHLGQNVVLWSCIPSGDGNGDGGWNTNMVAIDKTKTYRFSVFAKKTKVNGRLYFGPGGDSICSLNTSTKDPNPYFYGNQLVGLEDRWLLFIGYVNPFGLTGLRNNGEIWDCGTGQLVGQTSCFNWANDAFQVYHRCYLFYNNDDATNRQYMYAPRIDLVDGNEPSVSQLLGMPAIQSYATDKASQAKQDAISDAASKYTTRTEFSSSITALSQNIELKVAKTDFNALDNRVSSAETAINLHTGEIALKAQKSDVTVLGDRMSAAEAKITPDAINLTVKSQTEALAAEAAKRTEVMIDTTGLDVNTYYPITIGLSVSQMFRITVRRDLNADLGVPPWATHGGGFSVICAWVANGQGWGTIPIQRTVETYTYAWTKNDAYPVGSIGQMNNSNNEYIYVRGGSRYNVLVEGATGALVTLHTEAYTTHEQTIYIKSEIDKPVVDLFERLTKTEFSTQFVILNNSISSKVAQADFDSLGSLVSGHTSTLNQLPNTIDARITTQTNEGGIIKTNVESWFTMEGNIIKLGAKSINVSGATVFNSLATQTQAQGYATAALNTAKGYTDTLQTTLGDMAFQNQVTLAKLDSTIIDGGFLKTTLIAANSITADKIDVDSVRAAVVTADTIAALNITTGNLTVTDGAKIGGWSVEGNALIIRSAAAAKLIVQPDSTRSLRINDNSSSLMNIMARGIIGINIYTEQPAGTGVYVISQTGGTAIASYGSHIFRQRPGETWNAPGVLKCAEINGATGGVNWQWGDGFTSLSISKEGDGGYRIYHNLGHTEYFIHALPFVTWTNGQWHESVPCYVDITSSSIKLFFKSGSNNTCSPSYFQLMFFGRNRNA